MIKQKMKSSIKKRFKITASGKICAAMGWTRHNMSKRSRRRVTKGKSDYFLCASERKKVLNIIRSH